MKNLIEKTKTIHKKSFTLIELIAVLVVIGILAAIVIPNISSFKEEARETAMVADGKNLQTAIDMYQLDQHGDFPTIKNEDSVKPILGIPYSVDFNALYPAYIRDLPQAKNMYYWIDYQGQFYYSMIDNPNDFEQGDFGLTWTANKKAAGYKIHELESNTTGSSKNVSLVVVGELSRDIDSFIPDNYSKYKQYLINAVDEYGNTTPPVKSDYNGISPFSMEKSGQTIIPNTPEQAELINNPTNKMVASGDFHTLILKENGELWSFGDNRYGQLGHSENVGMSTQNETPKKVLTNVKHVSAGGYHTLVVKENGELWSFGNNRYGQLGHTENSGNENPNPSPKQIANDVEYTSAGVYHTNVVKKNGELWSFGHNYYGQLGSSISNKTLTPNPTPKKVASDIKYVSSGYQHTLFVKENGELWSYGRNYFGQLGYENNSGLDHANPTPKLVMNGVRMISAKSQHSLVLKENGELWSFGYNRYGQLGHSENIETSNANFQPKLIMTEIKTISAGSNHSFAVNNDGELSAFGYNQHGQLGYSTNSENTIFNPTPQKIMDGVMFVSAGNVHTSVLTENGQFWSFGRNQYGQLGYLTNNGIYNPNPTPKEITLTN